MSQSEKKTTITLKQALDFIKLYITNNDSKHLAQMLKLTDFNMTDVSESYKLLNFYLTIAYKNNSDASVPILIKHWSKTYPIFGGENSDDTFYTILFGNNLFTDQVIAYFAKVMNINYVLFATDLLDRGNLVWITNAMARAERIFGTQTHETYQELYNLIESKGEEYSDTYIMNFIIEKLEETANYAEKPKWIDNFLESDTLPTEKDIQDLVNEKHLDKLDEEVENTYQLLEQDKNKLIEIQLEGLSKYVSEEEVEKARQFLLENFKSEENIERFKQSILDQKREDLKNDIDLFRWFGPANPLIGQYLDSDSNNDKYGGCRLFLCDYFDEDDETNIVLDWFVGACQACHLKISNRYYAVRMPKPSGGWKGCYCSWECVRKQVYDYELFILEMIDIFEEEIIKNGIQDRIVATSSK